MPHDAPPKATAQDVIDTLRSIDAHLAALVAHFGIGAKPTVTANTSAVPAIAPDHDLDSKYGNPAVRAKDPRDWTGESQLGKPFSECPPAYLELVADRLEYFASQEEDAKKARYNRLDASRARGWAQRLRTGWKAPEAVAGFPSDNGAMVDSDDIPF